MDKPRYHWLDNLRGLALLSMIAYHAAWDLVYLFGVDWPFYHTQGAFYWQQATCWTFILLSGFCAAMSRRSGQRGLLVFGCGWIITLVMALFSPSTPNYFGVLVLLGSSMMLVHGLKPILNRIPPVIGMAGSFLIFTACRWITRGVIGVGSFSLRLPTVLYANKLTAFLGFPPGGFYSTDYFPLLPWFFLFLTGYFFQKWMEKQDRMGLLSGKEVPLLGWMGKYSLYIYMAHQPLIFGLLWVLFTIL